MYVVSPPPPPLPRTSRGGKNALYDYFEMRGDGTRRGMRYKKTTCLIFVLVCIAIYLPSIASSLGDFFIVDYFIYVYHYYETEIDIANTTGFGHANANRNFFCCKPVHETICSKKTAFTARAVVYLRCPFYPRHAPLAVCGSKMPLSPFMVRSSLESLFCARGFV